MYEDTKVKVSIGSNHLKRINERINGTGALSFIVKHKRDRCAFLYSVNALDAAISRDGSGWRKRVINDAIGGAMIGRI